MRLVDTHCHLDFAVFDDDFAGRLKQWQGQGLERYLVPAVNAANWSAVRSLAHHYPSIFYALGIHPCFLRGVTDKALDDLAVLLAQPDVSLVALGEIGLDGRFADTSKQMEIFEAQLLLAKKFALPVIIHSVKTHNEVLRLAKKHQITQGVIHAFSGSYEQAMAFVELGFCLGAGSVLCYEKARKTRAAFAKIPAEAILLETDAPDMVLPVAQKGQGQPSDARVILRDLALLRESDENSLAEVLWQNAERCFAW